MRLAEKEMTGNRPLFSVVIPAYNAERFILETLNSVRKQTFTDYEIIVVDDGSTDGTRQTVEDWARSCHIKGLEIISQKNKGLGGARNTGIKASQGEFIAFLDADDIWLEHKLARMADVIGQIKLADVICHDEWLLTDGKCKRVSKYGPYKHYDDLLWKGNCLSGSACTVRKTSLLEVGGFVEDRRFQGVEDYDLWLRLSKLGNHFEYIHEVLGVYRMEGQGLTGDAAKHCQVNLNILESHYAQWQPKTPYYRYRMRTLRSGAYRGASLTFIRQRNYPQAKRFLRLALKENPLSWKCWALILIILARLRV